MRTSRRQVAEGLGIEVPKAQPAARPRNMKPEVKTSPALSLFARPGDGSIRTRNIALLVAHGHRWRVAGEAASCVVRRRRRAAVRGPAARHRRSRRRQTNRRASDARNGALGPVRCDGHSRWRSRRSRVVRERAMRWSSSKISIVTARPSWRSAPASNCWLRPGFRLRPRKVAMTRDCCGSRLRAKRHRSSSRRWRGIGTSSDRQILRWSDSQRSLAPPTSATMAGHGRQVGSRVRQAAQISRRRRRHGRAHSRVPMERIRAGSTRVLALGSANLVAHIAHHPTPGLHLLGCGTHLLLQRCLQPLTGS